ncbi:hypothetical protein PFDG_02400 [Plasmodium falciparum Dd2]|uniref:EGF-like domain-containing protein n=1 Tax=Plasmodium falciparum (isolate Dd2) TaxID=57267 RepID=A0A0L7M7C4_PLAF4|nr:hypothetical protein PFDG_02400 [Plasmodium falciparum Dd2]
MFRIFFTLLIIILIKKTSAIDLIEGIFYEKNEIDKLTFSLDHRVRDNLKTDLILNNNGENDYAYLNKYVYTILNRDSTEKIKTFFSHNKDMKSCDYFISKEYNSSDKTNQICYKKTFCGVVIPNSEEIKTNKITNDKLYCAHFNSTHIIIYYISQPLLLEPHVVYEETFFEKGKNDQINCQGMYISLRSVHVHTHNAILQQETLTYIKNLCDGKNNCKFDFDSIKYENKSLTHYLFFINIQYQCISPLNLQENEMCDVYNDDTHKATCKYGFNKIELLKNVCEENYRCTQDICSVNQFCDGENETCTCKTSLLPSAKNNCEYNDLCTVLNCPENSTCEQIGNGKKAECKCENGKYYHNNKCYTKNDLELAIKIEPHKKEKFYKNNLYQGKALKPEYIFMQCENGFSIEVINAYVSCYRVSFNLNKLKYVTESLKKMCDGKTKCAYGNTIDPIDDLNHHNICNNFNTIFKYDYLCVFNNQNITSDKNSHLHSNIPSLYNSSILPDINKSKFHLISRNSRTNQYPHNNISMLEIQNEISSHNSNQFSTDPHTNSNNINNMNIKKVEIFRSRFSSKLQCQGGKINIDKAILKGGEGCNDLLLTNSLKSYCNDLSECDIGLIYHFDTYCINDQYLFVSYSCSNLCNKCHNNSTCYGNRFNYDCFCDNPYISKYGNKVCERPNDCESVLCSQNQVCQILPNDKLICQCEEGYKNVKGKCVPDNKCDLSCPSNKVCVIENGKQTCKCSERFVLENGVCICGNDYKMEDGINCIAKNKCKRKEYENICTNPNEMCAYNEETDIVKCECKEHYYRSSRGECILNDYCKDINCKENEECSIVNFKPECVCKENLKKNNKGECIYENSCLINEGNCPKDSKCIYREYKPHECVCNKQGHVAVNGKCVLEDKCVHNKKCSENSICVNVMNKEPICVCTYNYYKKDGVCLIQNPCLKDNGGCSRNSECTFKYSKINCTCKENYKNKDDSCVPNTNEYDESFTFQYNDDASIILGACGMIEFSYIYNQIIWKINNSKESYVFYYDYPTAGNIEVQIKNEIFHTIIYLKKKIGNSVIYDDFQVDHQTCIYENVFYYSNQN